MSDVAAVDALTKEDISYLRRASDIYAINIDGQNYLRCVKRADYGDAFSEDKRVDIPVEGNGKNGWFTSAWSFPWHTLRAGDGVRFEWYPNAHSTENLKSVGYDADVLFVHIRKGKMWAKYIAAVQTTPHDSLARMCRDDVPASFG